MRGTVLSFLLAVLISPALSGELRFSKPFQSDPAVDTRSYYTGWIFTRHFKANEPQETVFEEYTLLPGENLFAVAAKPEIYGDAELYPLLAAANPLYFKMAPGDREWLTIRIPRDIPAPLIEEARGAAWSPVYADAMGIRFDKAVYVAWLADSKAPVQLALAR